MQTTVLGTHFKFKLLLSVLLTSFLLGMGGKGWGQTATRFNDGYLTVFKVTSGATLGNTGTAIVTEEYIPTTTGQTSPNWSVSLPTGSSGVVISGSATSSGAMSRSESGRYLIIPGYAANIGDANSTFISNGTARTLTGASLFGLGVTGTIYATANDLRGATSDDATNYWFSGGSVGIKYTNNGTTVTTVSTTSTNTRVVNIFNGQLFYSTGSGTNGVYQVGAGKPTATGTTSTITAPAVGAYGFSVSPDGLTVYSVANSGNSIYKYTYNGGTYNSSTYTYSGGTWTQISTGFALTGATGVAVDWTNYSFSTSLANGAIVYACNPTTLVKGADAGTGAITTTPLRTISGNNAFRGLTFSPIKQTVRLGTNSPAASNIAQGTSNAVLFQFNLSADEGNSTIKKVTVNQSGTATIGSGNSISNFKLIYDANGNGVVDAGETTALASGAVSGSTIVFSGISQTYITQGSSNNYLVTGDVSSTGTGTFIPSIASNKTINSINYTTNLVNAGLSPVNIGTTAPTGNTLTLSCASPAAPTVSITQPTCAVATGTITVTAPTGTGITYSIDGTNYQAGTTFNNVAAGTTYNVTAKVSTCVSAVTTATVNAQPATPAAPTVSITQPTCAFATATITVTAPTGTGITYSIDGTNYQSGITFNNVAAGTTYNVTAQSSAGCISAITAATVNAQPATPAAPTVNITQPTCAVATGTITVTAPTGTGITYSIDGTTYQASVTFNNVTAGTTYNVTAKSSSGCISPVTTATVNAQPPTPVAPTVTLTQPTCTVATGTINVTAPTGSGLTYSIGGTYQASTAFNNVTAGTTYNVTVQNSSGCISPITTATLITQPATPAAPTVSVTQPTCTVATGIITVTAPIGTGITYSIDGTIYQSGTTFNNVAAGTTYNVTAQSSAGCISPVTIATLSEQPPTPAAPTVSIIQPTCTVATGTITVTAPTGTGITYSIDGTTYQSGTTFANVATGTYNVTVQSSAGCISSITTATVNAQPPAPLAPTLSITQPTCAVATGTITVTAPTGTGITYSIDGTTYQASTTFSVVTPGTYNVTAQSNAGCISSSTTATIVAQPGTPAAPTVSIIQPTCTIATGTITVTAPTGTGITYSIDGTTYQSGNTFTNIATGTYNVTVQNSTGCTSTATTATVNAQPPTPAAPTVNIIQPTCTVATGTITVTAPTGSGITYSIDGTTYQSGNTFTNVAASTAYNVTAQSSAGCISPVTIATLSEQPPTPAAPTVSIIQPTCTVATGTITVTAPTGTGITYSIDGTTYQSGTTFTNVAIGTYNVTVQNSTGCISSATTATVNAQPPAPPAPTVSITQPTCSVATGTITVTAPTGTGITYSIDGTTYQSGTTFANVATGTYNVTVQNSAGCISSATTATVNAQPPTPVISTQPSTSAQNVCQNGTASALSVTVSGTGLSYQWYSNTTNSNSGGTSINSANSSTYTPSTVTTGTLYYYVVVTNSTACSTTSDVSGAVTVNPYATITLSSAAGTDNQQIVLGNAITDVTYATTGSTGATTTGLPAGVTGSFNASTYTLSGTPTVAGTYNYNITTTSTSGCNVSASGTINVCSIPTQASTITFTNILSNSVTTGWTNGTGTGRVVYINTANAFTNPTNSTLTPTANPLYSGSGQQAVYNGTSNTVNVSGLDASTTYWFRVYEYNNCSGTYIYNTDTSLVVSGGKTTNPLSVKTAGAPLVQSGFTSLLAPLYTASGNTTRMPVMFRATVTGLKANTNYRYYTQAATNSTTGGGTVDFGTTNSGAGNSLFVTTGGAAYRYTSGSSLSTAGNYDSLTTDASGNYTGWFGFINTSNGRFTAGNLVYPSITLGNSAGTVLYRRTLDASMTVLAFSTSAGATNGSFLKSVTTATPKNLVALFDNTTASGRPIAISPVESIDTAIASLVTAYSRVNGSWNAIIPNTNANGIRMIEQLSVTTGALVGCAATDADGIWTTGNISTVNPTNSTTAKTISGTDDPLSTCPVYPEINVQQNGTDYLTASTYAYGNVTTGTTSDVTFTIQNTGTDTLKITGITVAGTGFTLVGASPTTILAGNSATMTVRFSPTAVTSYTGTVTIANNDNDEGSYVVNLTGTGVVPLIPVIAVQQNGTSYANNSTYTYSNTLVNDVNDVTFTIQNTGNTPLTISGVSVAGTAFSLQGTAPATVAAGSTATFVVRFAPTGNTTYTGSITINSNDPNQGTYVVNLSARAVVTTITAGTITGSPFCVSASSGASVSIPFTYTSPNFYTGNFRAELSDVSGSFTSPVIIGLISSDQSGSQTIAGTIPAGTVAGTGYRIRVVSSSPAITGNDNGVNLVVTNPVTPTVFISANPTGTICTGSSVTFTATPTNGGATPAYQWQVNSTDVSGATTNTFTTTTLANNDVVSVILTSSASCVVTSTASSSITETVTAPSTLTLTSAAGTDNQSINLGSAIAPVTYAVGGGGTGATVTGLPTGVTGTYSGGIFTINGTPTVGGTFTYTVTGTGGCSNNPTTTATIFICAAPTAQDSSLVFNNVSSGGMTVNWTVGNGTGRVVIMNTANTFTNPTNSTTALTANATYGGSGQQVVYNGTGNSVNVAGLIPSTTYWYRVYEYNNCSGTYTYDTASVSTNPLSKATTAAVVVQAGFTSVLTPQYMINNGSTRLPVMFRANVTGLTANTSYRYFVQGAISTDFGTSNPGAGNPLLINSTGTTYTYSSGASITTVGNYETFTTDASGNYTGWFGFVNTTNARFAAGNAVYPCIVIGTASGTTISRRALDIAIAPLAFSATSAATNGSFFQSKTSATPKNLVALFDNTAGTGRPLSITPVEYIANAGTGFGTTRPAGYDSSNGAWNAIIPNVNANGVRLIEQLSVTTGNLAGCAATDADGVWPTGNISTVNPTNGATVKVISGSDDPLASPTFTTQPSATPQSDCQNSAATPLSVTATGGTLTYQWYSNTSNANTGGTLISGATSSSYTPSTTVVGTTYYYVVISNATCSTTSNVSGAVTVGTVVTPTVSITANPSGVICSGSSVTFTAASTNGGATPAYQWQVNGANVSGATGNTFTTATLVNNDTVNVILTSSSSCVTTTTVISNTDTVTVTAPSTITLTSGAGTNNQSPIQGTAITPITYTIGGGGTGASVTGLPTGVTGNYSSGTFTISGSPTVTGTFNYTVTATGGCSNNPTASGTITVCGAPTTQAASIVFTNVLANSMTVGWTLGNGSGRIVIMNTANTFTNPTNSTTALTANPVYGGTGQQVVYNGTGNSVAVSGLIPSTTYWYRVYEYNNCSGTYVYNTATATSNPLSKQTTGTPLTQSNFISVLTPLYMPDSAGTVAGVNVPERLPVIFRATVTGLSANTQYRYYTQAATNSSANGATVDFGAAQSGAGNPLLVNSSGTTYLYTSTPGFTNSANYDVFTTDLSGNYTGWFGFVNTGNTRFTAGNLVYPTVTIANTSGTILYRRALDVFITPLSFKTTSTDTSGSFFQSRTFGTPKNLAVLFDNTAGTGRPLYIAPIEYIANTGVGLQYRATGYDSSNGAWNAIIPNNNANGVRLIEQLSVTTGNVVGCTATSATGVWPTGNISTVNPTNGSTVKIISGNDDPLAPPTISAQPSSTAQSVCQNSAATSLSVTATGGSLSFQWYSNTTASNSGGTLISGATSASFTPPTTTAGTLYYYVIVNNTASCSTTSNVSGSVTVNVTPVASFATSSYVACEGTAAQVVINGTPNATVTYTIGGATQPTATLNSSGSITLNSNTNAGTYNYVITSVALNTCSSTTPSSTTVTINPKPTVASITGPTNVAIGNSIALQDATTGGAWTIDASGAAEITSSNSSPATATIKGDIVGTSIVSYTVTNGTTGCTNTATYSVNVYNATIASYRTSSDGNYSDISVWEIFNGSAWEAATTIPGNSNNISVRHTILMDVDFNGTGSSTFAITSHVSGATTVNGNLTIAPNHYFASAGSVNFNNNVVTVQSTAAGNGAIGQMATAIAGATNVTVERYTDGGNSTTGKRAWRLITSPVTGVSINAAWQEGQVYNSTTGTNYLTGTTTAATKPVSYGTLVTSDIVSASSANAVGYDFTGGISSIKQYIPGVASGAWVSLADNQGTTKAGTLQDVRIQPAYMLFVRGNRTIGSGTSSTITTLRATGTVNQGSQVIGVIHTGGNIREVAGNPYASAIDFSAVYAQNSSRILNKFAVWVSRLGTYGAYTYVAGNGDGTYTATPNSIDGTGGGQTVNPANDRYIQSGEGFLVYPATGAPTGDIIVDETVKAPTQQATSTTTTFRLSPSTDKKLYVNLNLKDNDTSATLADGFLVRFDATYDAAINEDDGTKQSNFNENLGILSSGTNLIVEARPEVQKTDTLHMNLWNVKQRAYQLQMKGDNWTSAPNVHAYLVDNYLATKQEVSLAGSLTTVNFTVNSDSASWKSDRFSIVFQNSSEVLPVTLTSVKAAAQNGGVNVTWTVTNEQNIKTYTVERSINGGNSYTAIGSQQAKNQTAAAMTNYQSFDAAPRMGSNLYRIRIETTEGVVTYSSVVTVVIGQDNGKILITLYPNPVRPNGKVSLQLTNLATGTYLVNVYSQAGQTVYQKKITISQANTTQSEELKLGGSLAQGSYEVRISNSKGTIVYADKLVVGR